jgi:hypothetical protein
MKMSSNSKISNTLASSKDSENLVRSSGKKFHRPRSDSRRLTKKSLSSGEFSMDQELDMELSDSELIYIGSESEEEMESRYSINRTEQKQSIYISDDEGHQLNDEGPKTKFQASPVNAVTSKRTRNGAVKLDRKREYWSSKGNAIRGTP